MTTLSGAAGERNPGTATRTQTADHETSAIPRAALVADLGTALERFVPRAIEVNRDGDYAVAYLDPTDAREVARDLLDWLDSRGLAVTRRAGS